MTIEIRMFSMNGISDHKKSGLFCPLMFEVIVCSSVYYYYYYYLGINVRVTIH